MARFKTWQLFAVCVLAWGTTWHAITYQLGHTPPEVGVALRFALASLLVLAGCAACGISLRVAPRDHARLALQGALMFGMSYVLVYHAERHLPSGLVAVGYSASPLIAGLGAWALFGQRMSPRFVGGGVLGQGNRRNSVQLASYGVVNAGITGELTSKFTLSIQGNNLLNSAGVLLFGGYSLQGTSAEDIAVGGIKSAVTGNVLANTNITELNSLNSPVFARPILARQLSVTLNYRF